jgi:glutaredoxin 3
MNAVMWSSVGCVWCEKAKTLFENLNIPYEEKLIGGDYTKEDLLEAIPGARSVPQIFLDGEYVGGFDEMAIRLRGLRRLPEDQEIEPQS